MSRFKSAAALVLIYGTGAIAAGPANPDPAAVIAGSYVVEPAHTRVQFTVSHLGFTNWYGDFSGTSGSLRIDPKNIAASKVEISVPTASVSTTNAILDAELKSADWFDAARFPTIRFMSTAVVPTGPDTADITGDLTFHGITRPIVLAARFNAAGINPIDKAYTLGFDATTTIKRSEWGVRNYVPMIGDETTLRISAAFETARKAQ